MGLSAVGLGVAAAWRSVEYPNIKPVTYSTLHLPYTWLNIGTHHARREVGVVEYHCELIHTKNSDFDAARNSNCNIFFGYFSLGNQTSDYIEKSLKLGDIKAFSLTEYGSYYTQCAETSRHSSFCTASWPTRESEACCGLLV